MILTGAAAPSGAIAAGSLLVVYTAAITVMLTRGVDVSCGCLGIADGYLSWRIAGRNVVLLAGCVFVAVTPARWVINDQDWLTQLAIVVAAPAGVMCLARGKLISELMQYLADNPRPRVVMGTAMAKPAPPVSCANRVRVTLAHNAIEIRRRCPAGASNDGAAAGAGDLLITELWKTRYERR